MLLSLTWRLLIYFNPRTLQESATLHGSSNTVNLSISIHAPYKRVRPILTIVRVGLNAISIHAPYKRVRLHQTYRQPIPADFNPRTLQESATSRVISALIGGDDFNPRTLQESATIIGLLSRSFVGFQSTHPTRECDDWTGSASKATSKFQSTHPTRECDMW